MYFRLLLAALSTMAFFMSLQIAATAEPLQEIDEVAQVSYVVSLANGELPTIETPMRNDPGSVPGIDRRLNGADHQHSTVWVANHPPLFHAIGVPVYLLGQATDNPSAGLLGLRALNALLTAAMVALTGLLSLELMPGRFRTAGLAAATMASFHVVVFLGGFVYNDGLLGASAAALLVVLTRTLRAGITTPRIVGLCLFGSSAALTKAAGVPLVALAALGVMTAVLLRDAEPRGRVLRSLRPAAPVALIPAAAAGWFYLRNLSLYGDLTGSAHLLDRFGRVADPDAMKPLAAMGFLAQQWPQLFVHSKVSEPDLWLWVFRIVGLAALAGLVIAAIAGRVMRGSAGGIIGRARTDETSHERRGLLAARWVCASFVGIEIVSILGFMSQGGNGHRRYLIPITPLVAVVFAAGVVGLVSWLSSRARAQAVSFMTAFMGIALLSAAWILHSDIIGWMRGRAAEPIYEPELSGLLEILAAIFGLTAAVLLVVVSRESRRAAARPQSVRVPR